jgi:hypothetical protein
MSNTFLEKKNPREAGALGRLALFTIHSSSFIIHYAFCFLPCRHKHPPPPGGGGKETQAMRNHMQVVGLCPTPHKLFEKSLIKNFTKVVFCLASCLNYGFAETSRALAAPR